MADKKDATSSVENDSNKRQKMDSSTPQKTTLKEFEAVFTKLEEDLVEHALEYNLPKEQLEWYKLVSVLPPSLVRSIGPAAILELSARV